MEVCRPTERERKKTGIRSTHIWIHVPTDSWKEIEVLKTVKERERQGWTRKVYIWFSELETLVQVIPWILLEYLLI